MATAWLVLAGALLLRAIVPAGFMPMVTANGVEIVACPGMAASPAPQGVAMAAASMAGMAHHAMPGPSRDDHPAPAKADVPCAFTGLTAPSIGGVDIVLLAIAVAIVSAAALSQRPDLRIAPGAFLRPPLRGPPALR